MRKPTNTYTSKLDKNRKPRKGWVPTQRQRGLLEQVWAHGLLTDKQVGWLENVGYRRAQELMKPLWDNGFLNRPNPKVRARYPFMFYWLTKKGARIVAERQAIEVSDLDWMRRPRWSQVEHDAWITDFRIILSTACAREDHFTMLQWINETSFRSWQDQIYYQTLAGNKRKRRIVIDGYAKVRREVPEQEHPFFSRLMVEIELSHKSNPRFADHKVLPSMAYLRSEIFQKRFGSNSGRFLYIVPTERKMNNYRKITQRAVSASDQVVFYFTTFEQVSVESILFGDIWLRPGDTEPISLFKSNL